MTGAGSSLRVERSPHAGQRRVRGLRGGRVAYAAAQEGQKAQDSSASASAIPGSVAPGAKRKIALRCKACAGPPSKGASSSTEVLSMLVRRTFSLDRLSFFVFPALVASAVVA